MIQFNDDEASTEAKGASQPIPWQPRFGIKSILLLMLVCSVLGAGCFYLVRGVRNTNSTQVVFIIFMLAAPALLLVLMSVGYAIFTRWIEPKLTDNDQE